MFCISSSSKGMDFFLCKLAFFDDSFSSAIFSSWSSKITKLKKSKSSYKKLHHLHSHCCSSISEINLFLIFLVSFNFNRTFNNRCLISRDEHKVSFFRFFKSFEIWIFDTQEGGAVSTFTVSNCKNRICFCTLSRKTLCEI